MNVGIIGSGNIGRVHARMAANCGLKITVCGDTRRENAESLAKEYGAEATTDCRGLAARDDVDIVCVATPTPSHAEYVIAAAQAGKHIFCEKPFCRTVDECRDAIAAAEKAGIKLFVAHVVRYFQEFEAIRAQVRAGEVGDVGFVRTTRGGQYPRGEGDWFGDYAQSGGVTLDAAIHDYDWLRYMFGEPETVFCQNLKDMTSRFLDYSLATFRFKSGVITHTVGTWAQPSGFRVRVEVVGTKGLIRFDSDEAPIRVNRREKEGSGPGVIVPGSPVTVSPYQLEWEDFIGWVEGKHEPRVTAQDGLEAVRMATAALESAETGKEIRL